MAMTRKDFELLAAALGAAERQMLVDSVDAQTGFAYALAGLMNGLAEVNPRFDRDRFVRRVGIAARGADGRAKAA